MRVPPVEEIRRNAEYVSQASSISVSAADWPWWQGITHNNHASGPTPPTEIKEQAVLWKTEIPGRGHSTPILWGGKLYLTTADETASTQSLLAFDANTGENLWSTQVHEGDFMRMNPINSQASPSPATDGTNIFTVFMINDGIWVSAISPEGKILWQQEAGPFRSQDGYGASPLIFESLLIVQADCEGPGFLAALDRATGEIIWRTARPDEYSHGTPTIAEIAGKPQLILGGQNRITGYDPQSGELLWSYQGLSRTTVNTPQVLGDVVYASGGNPEHLIIALRVDGEGELDPSHLIWEAQKKVYVPTLMVDSDYVYAFGDDGVAVCYNAATGDEHWKKRLGGDFFASPTLIGDLIYIPNEAGELFILKAGPEFELVSSGKLSGAGFASPVIVDGRIYWRTSTHLYCLAQQ
ncbi:PQQ-binding-like beta-propeller repeat protein [Blastopirellula sp. J2-11]|uniref:outer membrane protein assembly factor BamB family protein n=1 Tax=Blastopirellula sp. J2-11 TaxID=2943192 RepID=UPI0021CAA9FF|nr:PQQ-binding-like beta-propeller repeat protein [Blastopirellula sp. J2-11]UUO09313.1 PQQ-binding-like beta-propeller repeat protein [Blastopirellula sp. J2-11]